jgi:hypothetical protein
VGWCFQGNALLFWGKLFRIVRCLEQNISILLIFGEKTLILEQIIAKIGIIGTK